MLLLFIDLNVYMYIYQLKMLTKKKKEEKNSPKNFVLSKKWCAFTIYIIPFPGIISLNNFITLHNKKAAT